MSVLSSDLKDRFENVLTVDAKPSIPQTPVEDDLLDLFDLTGSSTSKIPGGRPLFNNSSSSQSRQSECKFDPTSDIKFPSGKSNDPDDDVNAHSGGQKKNASYKRKPSKPRAPSAGGITIINSSDIKISPKTSYTCNINQHVTAPNAFPAKSKILKSMPTNVRDLSECEEEISKKDMLVIKEHMGSGWRDVARKLDYTEGKIQQFQENFISQGLDEVIYQFLLDWKQIKSNDAKLGILIKAMWSSHEYDCVKVLAKSRKESSQN